MFYNAVIGATLQWTVLWEPHFILPGGVLKPDIVAFKEQDTIIIDAQVVGTRMDLAFHHNQKVEKYSCPLLHQAARDGRTGTLKTTSITLNFRGVWSAESARDLQDSKLYWDMLCIMLPAPLYKMDPIPHCVERLFEPPFTSPLWPRWRRTPGPRVWDFPSWSPLASSYRDTCVQLYQHGACDAVQGCDGRVRAPGLELSRSSVLRASS
ncbi:hypothetical protein HPB47_020886 [Ixodes persulcatus]|uniref:Uncharacterized protein n=1 Tax=Ixodes persulcatus TaxID=34615 RepID=A0AC60QEX8_IXOPE|nr:hypothetical protein HPB47_020886 [Ixodes persulcatus]